MKKRPFLLILAFGVVMIWIPICYFIFTNIIYYQNAGLEIDINKRFQTSNDISEYVLEHLNKATFGIGESWIRVDEQYYNCIGEECELTKVILNTNTLFPHDFVLFSTGPYLWQGEFVFDLNDNRAGGIVFFRTKSPTLSSPPLMPWIDSDFTYDYFMDAGLAAWHDGINEDMEYQMKLTRRGTEWKIQLSTEEYNRILFFDAITGELTNCEPIEFCS